MGNDPGFVRLRTGVDIIADVGGSGWAISGLDVREMPEEGSEAHGYVQTRLAQGVLEPASRAEFEEVQEHAGSGEPPQVLATISGTHQEQDLLDRAASVRTRVSASRKAPEEYEAEEAERRAQQAEEDAKAAKELAERVRKDRASARKGGAKAEVSAGAGARAGGDQK